MNHESTSIFRNIFSASVSSFIISPSMTVIDTSVIRNQLVMKNSSFWDVCKDTVSKGRTDDVMKRNLKNGNNVMFSVYGLTYATANLTESYCKQNEIHHRMPTACLTTLVNMIMIAWKDNKYVDLFGGNKKISIPVKNKVISNMLFGIRDGITVSSSFALKQDVCHYFEKNYNMKHNVVDGIASFALPMCVQLLSSPIHIVAIQIASGKYIGWKDAWKEIRKNYKATCYGRIIRVIPAFGVGGIVNDYFTCK